MNGRSRLARSAAGTIFSLSAAITIVAGAAQPPAPDAPAPSMSASGPAAPHAAAPRSECTRPSGPALQAADLLSKLRAGEDVIVDGRLIEGTLDIAALCAGACNDADDIGVATAGAPGAAPGSRADRVITGRLSITNSTLAGRLLLDHSVLARGIALRCTQVAADLDLTDAIVRGDADLSDARVTGPVRLAGLRASGDLHLDRVHALDRLDLSHSEIAGHVSLAGADLQHGIEAAGFVAGSLDLSWSASGAPLSLRDGIVLGDLALVDSDLPRGLTIANTRVTGKLDLREARIANGATLDGVRVQAALLGGVESADVLEMRSCAIGSRFSLFDAQIGSLRLSDVRVAGSVEWDDLHVISMMLLTHADLGEAFTADGAIFGGRCEIRSSRIPGENPFDGAEFAHPVTLIDSDVTLPPEENPVEPGAEIP